MEYKNPLKKTSNSKTNCFAKRASMSEYDQHCTGPFTRHLIWNPESTYTTSKSKELLFSYEKDFRSSEILVVHLFPQRA